jgi:hypothetical protein
VKLVPLLPELPDEPEEPLVPELPDEPELPLVPDDPLLPDVPELPDEPDVPEDPELPVAPFTPDEPDEPDVPDAPMNDSRSILNVSVNVELSTTNQVPVGLPTNVGNCDIFLLAIVNFYLLYSKESPSSVVHISRSSNRRKKSS